MNRSPALSAFIAQQIAGPLPAQHDKASHSTRCMQPSGSLQPVFQDGHYGEQRMFASAGWGIFSALSGYLVSKYSIYTAFQLYFALAAFAIIPVCFLKFHAKPHFQQVSCSCLASPQVYKLFAALTWQITLTCVYNLLPMQSEYHMCFVFICP
jgi:hypothetical protein